MLWIAAVVVTFFVACAEKSSANPTVAPAPSSSSAVAPPPAAPRPSPSLETRCERDADCATFSEETAGDHACCPGCTWSASTKESLARFRSACEASPARECPGLGCLMPIVSPRCVAQRCVAAPAPR